MPTRGSSPIVGSLPDSTTVGARKFQASLYHDPGKAGERPSQTTGQVKTPSRPTKVKGRKAVKVKAEYHRRAEHKHTKFPPQKSEGSTPKADRRRPAKLRPWLRSRTTPPPLGSTGAEIFSSIAGHSQRRPRQPDQVDDRQEWEATLGSHHVMLGRSQ